MKGNRSRAVLCLSGLVIVLSWVCLIQFYKNKELRSRNDDLERRVADGLPLSEDEFPKHVESVAKYHISDGEDIVQTVDYVVISVYTEKTGVQVATLRGADGTYTRCRFLKNIVPVDEVLWWNKNGNVLHRGSRGDYVSRHWNAATRPSATTPSTRTSFAGR